MLVKSGLSYWFYCNKGGGKTLKPANFKKDQDEG